MTIPRDQHVICEVEEENWNGVGPCYRAGCVRVPFSNGAIVELISGGYACVEWDKMRAAEKEEVIRIEKDFRIATVESVVDQSALDQIRKML